MSLLWLFCRLYRKKARKRLFPADSHRRTFFLALADIELIVSKNQIIDVTGGRAGRKKLTAGIFLQRILVILTTNGRKIIFVNHTAYLPFFQIRQPDHGCLEKSVLFYSMHQRAFYACTKKETDKK